jgi:transcriptional antiterminator
VSQQQLTTETGLSERAVKYALKELVQRRLADFRILLNDTRRKLYYSEAEKSLLK